MNWWHTTILGAVLLAGVGVGVWVLARLAGALGWLTDDLAPDTLSSRDEAAIREELLSR